VQSSLMQSVRVALIGDFDPQITAHRAIERSLQLLSSDTDGPRSLEWKWIATSQLTNGGVTEMLSAFDAVWCVPGSPYKSESGAMAAIQFARTNNKPFLGTCAGCQHAVLEYARNVLGITGAENAEGNPQAAVPLISPLLCSLVEVDDEIHFTAGSRVEKIYGKDRANESYHCRFGLNPKLEHLLSGSQLEITGRDKNGEARAFEIKSQKFYILTQYQPERSALAGKVHPLIEAFVKAAGCRQGRRPLQV
jgi:CTP synthase (UTP-ammonia lyase)